VFRATGHGGILMVRNLSVFVLLLIFATVAVLWVAFSYGAPALLDKLDKPPGELFTTTTAP
jgi:hypothetical protein